MVGAHMLSSNHLVMDHRNLELNSSQRTEDFIPGKFSIRHLACQAPGGPQEFSFDVLVPMMCSKSPSWGIYIVETILMYPCCL